MRVEYQKLGLFASSTGRCDNIQMLRVVTDQIIASTSLDSHGERLSEAELTSYFEQMAENSVGVSAHDLSQVPAFRSFNKRLLRTPAGDLAIVVDVEVLDEERYSTFGGYSIAFTRRHWRFGRAPSYPRITINTRQFDFDAVGPRLAESLPRTPFELVERVEKIDVATLAIIGIAVGGYLVVKVTAAAISSVFAGFFEEAGKDLYHAAKRLPRSDQPNGPIEVQFHLHLHEPPRRPAIIISADPRCTENDVAAVGRQQLNQLLHGVDTDAFDRITAKLLPGGRLERIAVIPNAKSLSATQKSAKPTRRKKRRKH